MGIIAKLSLNFNVNFNFDTNSDTDTDTLMKIHTDTYTDTPMKIHTDTDTRYRYPKVIPIPIPDTDIQPKIYTDIRKIPAIQEVIQIFIR